jgi:hypothetical protein
MIEKDVGIAHAAAPESSLIFNEVVSSEFEIDSIIGRPNSRVLAKVTNRLDDLCREFIAASPFLVVSSSDAQGRMDCSPKGDLAGFVHVLDDWTLLNDRATVELTLFATSSKIPRWGLSFSSPAKGRR